MSAVMPEVSPEYSASQLSGSKMDEVFDVLHAVHLETGHASRDIMHKKTSEQYSNITKEIINTYLHLCETCQLKKSKFRKSIVVKPTISNNWNSRCQVDLIDMQSQKDGDNRFILNYQDHLTKYVTLRPLKTKTAEEVAYQLIDIFCDKGAPHILQSDNGREFSNKIIKEVVNMWPDCKFVHGKPRHSQSQGSVERVNQYVEAILACWQKENNTKHWSEGLRFVQGKKNNRFHKGIGRSPYEAMFGCKSRLGIHSLNIPDDLTVRLETEEQLEKLAKELAPAEEEEATVASAKEVVLNVR